MAYCYTKLTILFLSIGSDHRHYPQQMAKLWWPGYWLSTKTQYKYPQEVTYTSNNPASCKVTSLMWPMLLCHHTKPHGHLSYL